MFVEVFLSLLALLVVFSLAWLRIKTAAGRSTLQGMTGRILLITAHPDDECMFFAPTIMSLGRSVRAELFLLCLSEGTSPIAFQACLILLNCVPTVSVGYYIYVPEF